MTLESDRFAAVTALDRLVSRRARLAWRQLRVGGELQSAFVSGVLPVLLESVTSAQREAAALGVEYVERVGAAESSTVPPAVRPSAFAGVASDGRSLRTLLSQPIIESYRALGTGTAPAASLRQGGALLERIVVTQVHDAAREAEHVGLVANRTFTSYIRTVEPGACGRCVILAGRAYKWNDGFLRHPKCRCSHHPVTRDVGPQDPKTQFDAMSREQQDRAFTVDGAQAVRDGADPARVVNARKGMSTAVIGGRKVQTTSVLGGGRPRLMPGEIYKLARGDRAEAIRLLRQHRFIF